MRQELPLAGCHLRDIQRTGVDAATVESYALTEQRQVVYRDGLTFTGYKCDLDWSYLPEALN